MSYMTIYCSKQYGAERDNGNIMREGERRGGWIWGCLMTPGFSKDIRSHV